MGNETRRHRHLDGDVFLDRHTLDGNERSAGADVDGGSEFEHGPAIHIGAVNEHGKSDREALPTTGSVLGFAHTGIVRVPPVLSEITQVSSANPASALDFSYSPCEFVVTFF
jgi:hypothetical protein